MTKQKSNFNYPDQLLKQAANEKKTDINKSINTLRQALKNIQYNKISYSIDVFLRLPLYLQQAQRKEEALSEFNRLLDSNNDRVMKNMENSIILDKMRLFYERENHKTEALRYGILSYVVRYYAYIDQYNLAYSKEDAQERRQRAYEMASKEAIKIRLGKVIKKTRQEHEANDISNVVYNILTTQQRLSRQKIYEIILNKIY